MVKKQISETIRRHSLIPEQAHIILGLSGGPDSVCLFHVLCSMSAEHGWTIHPVHVNHKFRPGAAEEDQAYTEQICREAGRPCRTFICDCSAVAKEEKMTAEEAGRKVRYEAFAEVAAALRAQGIPPSHICIAVAQNADDQAETVLFRILRGAGTDGLSGIRYVRSDGEGNRIVRPLLDVSREAIEAYCTEQHLYPRTDHTNSEPIYARNRIRLELIPYLQREYNPAVKDTMVRMAKSAAEDSDCLWQQALDVWQNAVRSQKQTEILLSGELLRSCHRAVRQRVIAKAFAEIGLTEDLSRAHFESCETIVFHPEPSARCSLPRGFYLTKVYGDVRVGKADSDETAATAGTAEIRVHVADVEEFRRMQPERNTYAVFDLAVMTEHLGEHPEARLTVGYRCAGDFIPVGEGRNKKIQDFFVDRKIPRDERDRIPLLKIGHEVLWVMPSAYPGRFSAKYKVSDSTKKVICVEIIC